jgi:hypothetical protein
MEGSSQQTGGGTTAYVVQEYRYTKQVDDDSLYLRSIHDSVASEIILPSDMRHLTVLEVLQRCEAMAGWN